MHFIAPTAAPGPVLPTCMYTPPSHGFTLCSRLAPRYRSWQHHTGLEDPDLLGQIIAMSAYISNKVQGVWLPPNRLIDVVSEGTILVRLVQTLTRADMDIDISHPPVRACVCACAWGVCMCMSVGVGMDVVHARDVVVNISHVCVRRRG